MAAAWSRGHRILADEVISRHPDLDDEAAVRLIYEEVSLRRDSGEDTPTSEIIRRYPRWKDELEVLLGCDRLLRPRAGIAALPEVGEHLGPFYLRAELGRGASGRTFLASEPTLADRPVVLKVLSDDQEEHLSLARLQHTNIIPLFSEHTFPERGLRALCMPYLGGASLARILDALASIPPADRRGRDIVHVLDRVQAAGPDPTPLDRPYRRGLEQVSYVDAICWIGIRLADALHEAHTHGLVHMDVKPSNVLIASDGSPMLLDFHLACRPIRAGERFPERIGGTPGWMAPEHRAAMEAVTTGKPIPAPVDHRADLYALGLLLREALGASRGSAGAEETGSIPLRQRNPEVSVGLADILARCLAERPSARYPGAAALADDLRRQLEHLPLKGVPNRPIERLRKLWRRRELWALGRGTLILSSLLIIVAVGLSAWNADLRRQDALADLHAARALCTAGRFADAAFAVRRGLERAAWFPGANRLAAELDRLLRAAHRGQRAETLHRLADQVRFRYGVDPPRGAEAAALLRSVGSIWADRDILLDPDPPPDEILARLEDQIRADLLELVATWAEVRVQMASDGGDAEARHEVLGVLEESRAALGPSPAIGRLVRSLGGATGDNGSREPSATESNPKSPLDRYDLGRSLLRSGRFQEAAEQFRRGLDRRPQDFWPNFYLGLCEYRLKHFRAAESAFSIAIALAPTRAEAYFNRALAAEGLGHADQAHRDYSRALELEPNLAAARLNRGILAYRSGRPAEAIGDLRHALQNTNDARIIGRIHYNLALAHQARGDRDSALASAEEAAASGDAEARALCDRLRADR
ncbi:MAG: tetratricopeptide repeat protein [Isosphaeraceae bacterium]